MKLLREKTLGSFAYLCNKTGTPTFVLTQCACKVPPQFDSGCQPWQPLAFNYAYN